MPRLVPIATLAVLCMAGGTPAAASLTVGQVAPGVPTSCSKDFDFLQHSTPDNSYAMPAAGTITSWTHHSQVGVGQTPTLKIFRRIGDPARYQLVGHDGPHPIAANTTETFPASVGVQAGDVLGITGDGGAANIGCYFTGSGETAFRMPNLSDGDVGDFTLSSSRRLNVSAVINPTNGFTVGAVSRNKKRGTAILSVTVPNPGELNASGAGAKASGAAVITKAVAAGATSLLIEARGGKRKKLNATGKTKLNLTISYTPTGGELSTQSVKVKLKKKK